VLSNTWQGIRSRKRNKSGGLDEEYKSLLESFLKGFFVTFGDMENKVLIGLTGSFGSGCSTLRKVLEEYYDFVSYKLSEEVREEAKKENIDESNRENLQNLGNSLRKEKGTNYLALRALEKAKQANGNRIIFHGIRNFGEVKEFRKHADFYLIAVDCSKDNRWERLKGIYKGDFRLFERDDKRDKNEGLDYGQQVLRCVEDADIVFINDENYTTQIKIQNTLRDLFRTHLDLITGDKLRNPTQEETMMTAAATLALNSHCIKRRVGAVLCRFGYIISAAYNEVPGDQKKCLDEYGMCYRDHVRSEFNKGLLSNFTFCPICSKKLNIASGTICKNCGKDLSYFIPQFKALDKCRSLHAEETVILKVAGDQINGSILYSTTFPCLQCAKRILHSGIKQIVYIDPYPEEESIEMLESGGVKTEKFQGVKAQAYYKLFYPFREILEKEIRDRLSSVQKERR